MTITGRISATFLGVIALILAGFSVALWLLAMVTLNREVDARLQAALSTLSALVEDEPGGLAWEPDDRLFTLGRDPGRDQVRWRLFDARGREVDRSSNLDDPEILGEPGPRQIGDQGFPWRVAQRSLTATHPAALETPEPNRSNALVLTVGLRLEPLDQPLQHLALALMVLSGLIWGSTALAGRRLCQTALAPLTRMAAGARSLQVDEPGQRLPAWVSGDELEDLSVAFNGLLVRWQEALERQANFAGDASHQLRTPLTAIIGQVDVILRRDRSAEDYRRALSRVRDQSNRLRQIVEALLFLARADAEAALPDLQPVGLEPWVTEQVARHLDAFPDKPLRWFPSGARWMARIHPPLLAEALDNLIQNARDHASSADPVDVRLSNESGWVLISVEDRGPGISLEDQERIFEPFYRGPGARRSSPGGAGLGLAVARRIARAMGGRLEAASRPNGGSRFTLSFPKVLLPARNRPTDALDHDASLSAETPVGGDSGISGTPEPTSESFANQ